MSLMTLGMFVFSLRTAPFQESSQQIGWKHPSNPRVGARPARQYTGPDEETITLSGVLYPELTGGERPIAQLRAMGDRGAAYPLIDGTGRIYGQYVIEGLDCKRETFFDNGVARKIEFTLKLARVDDRVNNVRPTPRTTR